MSVRPFAEVLDDGRVAVHAVKATYVLEPGEIVALLPSCRSLWIEALRRGKCHRRAEATAKRVSGTGARAAEGAK